MSAPLLDFRTTEDLQPLQVNFFEPIAGAVFTFEAAEPCPPDYVEVHNPLEEPLLIDVIDATRMFRNAPNDIVEALFLRAFVFDTDAMPHRMAEPCMKTGDTVLRGSTTAMPLCIEAHNLRRYILKHARFYAHRFAIQPGQSVVVDNKRMMVSFPVRRPLELRMMQTEDEPGETIALPHYIQTPEDDREAA